MKEILAQAQAAIAELLSAAVTLKPGDMMVVGCSTSEICGQMIGTGSSQEAAKAVMDALLPAVKPMAFSCASNAASTSTAAWWWNGPVWKPTTYSRSGSGPSSMLGAPWPWKPWPASKTR